MIDTLLLLASFGLLSIASDRIGVAFRRLGLPTITGYLFAGSVAGSFALDLIPSTATEDLRFVDEIALAVIAFVAGSELYLKEIKPASARFSASPAASSPSHTSCWRSASTC